MSDQECRIIRQSLQNLHQNSKKFDGGAFDNTAMEFDDKPKNMEGYISMNKNIDISTQMASEYGIVGEDKLHRSRYNAQNQNSQSRIQNPGYSVLNPCYSDVSSMNISGLPNNKNHSAILM